MRKAAPRLPAPLLYRAVRQKDIKINGARCQPGDLLKAGDLVTVYLPDEVLAAEEALWFLAAPPLVEAVYEDEQILLCSKPRGLLVHAAGSATDTMIGRVLHYLYQKGEWDPKKEHSFTPALCNRIDRNTGGIVIAAKTFEALQILSEKLRRREVERRYLCLVAGRPEPPAGILKGYHTKDAATNTVQVTDRAEPGAKVALSRYRVLESRGDQSLLEVELLTGRTHQIRAQLAAMGHPLQGDPKYGGGKTPRPSGGQALWAYRVTFAFVTPAGPLDYLKGKSFSVEAPFAGGEAKQTGGKRR